MIDTTRPVVFPTLSIQIETCGTCNAGCHFCVYPSIAKDRAGKMMTRELFRKIVDEVVTIPVVSNIKLMGLNEPLLDPRLDEFIGYIKSIGQNLGICIYTNGLLLTPKRQDRLREAGLTDLIVSLNAVRPEQHDKIMGMKNRFDTICRNIDYARGFSTPRVEVHAVYTSDTFTEADVQTFHDRWGSIAKGTGIGLVAQYANWSGDIDVPAKAVGLVMANEWCHRATESVYILFDGRVTTCCLDPLGKQVFGDLNTQTLREIYNSEKYTEFRRAHSQNRADEYELCRNCTRI